MGSVQINVRGWYVLTAPPERATVLAAVTQDGPDPDSVFAAVGATLNGVRAGIEALHDPARGPVTRYAVDQVRVGSHRPWNADGEQLPPVHTATVAVSATFCDFDALGRWVAANAATPGMQIGTIDWTLPRRKRAKLERRARRKALHDARCRAQDYADALGLGAVRVRSVSDPGVGVPVGRKMVFASAMPDGPGQPPLSLRPEDVAIEAAVEASFTVSRH